MTRDKSTWRREPLLDRRRWLTIWARRLLLGAVGALSAVLVGRSLLAGCPTPASPCSGCRLLERCQLPRGRAARRTSRLPDRT